MHWHKTALICALAFGLSLPTAGAAQAPVLSVDDARHLLARTGFGAAPHEIATMVGQTRADAIDAILGGIRTQPVTPMPPWVDRWPYPYGEIHALGPTAEELFFTNRWLDMAELQHWWLTEMLATPSPLTDRLTLFWHDHFATAFEGVEHAHWMADQHLFLRQNAAGNYADLAAGILNDAAVRVYLTNTENHRDAPNENLAREYLELFMLGEGRGYDQADIAQTARALTGHSVDWAGASGAVFDPDAHDPGEKTILGQSGAFTARDLPSLVMTRPEFGPHIVAALWREFVSPTPDPVAVTQLVALWRAADWALRPLLRALFLSDAFWAPEARGQLVKDPVDLLVGTARTFGIVVPLSDMVWASEDLGQALFFPPNVGGWPEGVGWITDATVRARTTALTAMMALDDMPLPGPFDRDTGGTITAPQKPGTLRVGQVFALEAERFDDGGAGLLVHLFDVGFAGQTWRSLPVWFEIWDDDAVYIALNRSDCAPDCFAGWPFDIDGDWIGYEPRRGLGRNFARLPRADRLLLETLVGHLPQLVAQTRGQVVWTETAEGDAHEPLGYRAARRMARAVSEIGSDAFGATTGAVIFEPSHADLLGLGGIAPDRIGQLDLDEYYDDREAAMDRPAAPARVYPDLDAWFDALPGDRPGLAKVQAALLAVPAPKPLIGSDRAAQIRALVLSPEFQLY